MDRLRLAGDRTADADLKAGLVGRATGLMLPASWKCTTRYEQMIVLTTAVMPAAPRLTASSGGVAVVLAVIRRRWLASAAPIEPDIDGERRCGEAVCMVGWKQLFVFLSDCEGSSVRCLCVRS